MKQITQKTSQTQKTSKTTKNIPTNSQHHEIYRVSFRIKTYIYIKKLASFRGGFASEASKTTPGGGPKGRRKLGNEVSKM